MKLQKLLGVLLLLAGVSGAVGQTGKVTTHPGTLVRSLTVGKDGQFLLDGKAFEIRAGSMHYPPTT
jgi:hypothetical protein